MSFDIIKTLNNTIEILDYSSNYETSFSKENKKYTYLDTATIDFLIKTDSNQTDTSLDYSITIHYEENEELKPFISDPFTLSSDGLYNVIHVIIPLKTWLDKYIELDESTLLSTYDYIYVYDKSSLKFFLYANKTYTELSISDLYTLLEANINSTLLFDNTYTFIVNSLETCYYNICKTLLSQVCNSCNTISSYERDILWMALNVIKYLLEKGAFFEAQRVLELITGCTGFCNNNLKQGGSGCGCS